ncbi:MAG: aminotransferase class V-fold PLP-dependent enzyme [Saprospiraceae bacterium]|nr:aminotransferase class V-fold PLP-dependent enzyme [Saprospiraceae bacterium]
MTRDLEVFNRIAEKLIRAEKETGVVKQIPFESLKSTFDLDLPEDSTQEEAFEKALTELVLNTPRTSTKLFFNQLFGGRKSKASLGELLSVLLNNSMYTYKVGGPMIAIEKNILNKISDLVGFKSETLGTIASGGSMTNYMGMVMARDKYDPDFRYKGRQVNLVGYSSIESHYSIAKNAAFSGVGRDNIRYIQSDEHGKMNVKELESQIQQDLANGYRPFFVNATAGTTVMGAFDPLIKISEICKQYDLWMHVDGAYGASVIFSDKYKHLIEGAHLADSFTINAHKMLGTPITCSIILTPHKNCLYDSFSNEASYLYQSDDNDINPGKISLQCGRRNDALKFWTLWKSVGTKGLGDIVDQEFHLADVAREYVRSNPDYTLYSFDNSINICFNYKSVSPEKLCNKLYEAGKLVVGYGKFKDQTFVRLVTVNSNNTKEDLIHFFKVLEEFAETL